MADVVDYVDLARKHVAALAFSIASWRRVVGALGSRGQRSLAADVQVRELSVALIVAMERLRTIETRVATAGSKGLPSARHLRKDDLKNLPDLAKPAPPRSRAAQASRTDAEDPAQPEASLRVVAGREHW